MTHSVEHTVRDETGAAFSQACRYPNGTNVLCATVIELDGGLIVSQTVVQVWDESDQERSGTRTSTPDRSDQVRRVHGPLRLRPRRRRQRRLVVIGDRWVSTGRWRTASQSAPTQLAAAHRD